MMTLTCWIKKNLDKDQIVEIVRTGCQGGVNGLIYYPQTTKLYNRFHDEIWQLLFEAANTSGQTCLEFIAQLGGNALVSHDDAFKQFLVWYAVEQICYDSLQYK